MSDFEFDDSDVLLAMEARNSGGKRSGSAPLDVVIPPDKESDQFVSLSQTVVEKNQLPTDEKVLGVLSNTPLAMKLLQLGLGRSQGEEMDFLLGQMRKLERGIFTEENYKRLGLVERVGLLQQAQAAYSFRQGLVTRAEKIDMDEIRTELLKSLAGSATGMEGLEGIDMNILSDVLSEVIKRQNATKLDAPNTAS